MTGSLRVSPWFRESEQSEPRFSSASHRFSSMWLREWALSSPSSTTTTHRSTAGSWTHTRNPDTANNNLPWFDYIYQYSDWYNTNKSYSYRKGPTTIDEGLQQVIFRQSFLYLHTDNITADPHGLVSVLSSMHTYISKTEKKTTQKTVWSNRTSTNISRQRYCLIQ